MPISKTIAAVLFCLFFCEKLPAQSGFLMAKGQHQVDIPFEFENNFIIIEVVFNKIFPLKFIFDTGAEHTILTKRQVPDLLGIEFEREFRILGSDMKTELIAYLCRNIRLDIPDKVVAPREAILVLDDDYFRFEEFAGVNVHGILGGNTFSKYIIRINYQRQIITLLEREYFDPPAHYQKIDLEVFRNKPYLTTLLRLQNDSIVPVKLLLDTGAGLSLMLFPNTHSSLTVPPNVVSGNLGMGLGGYLEGVIGRVKSLKINELELPGVLTWFQEIDTSLNREHLNKRNGIIGNRLLSRFHLILDFGGEVAWFKPAKNFDRLFDYDRSGLSVVAGGTGLNHFSVQQVLPGSPADEAGLQPGDRILKVGRLPAPFWSLAEIQRKLEGKPGRRVRLKIRRGEEVMKKTVELRDLI